MSYELNAGGKQLAEVIEKVTWSGDSKQVARKLNHIYHTVLPMTSGV